MAEFASKGVGGTALGLSVGALGLELLRGGLGGLFNGGSACHEDHYVNRYEASQSARIAQLETEVKLRDANTFTMSEMGRLRDYIDNRFSTVEKELSDQKVYNATNIATVNCISNQIAQLMSLTKLVIPNTSICPGWGNATVTPSTTTAG